MATTEQKVALVRTLRGGLFVGDVSATLARHNEAGSGAATFTGKAAIMAGMLMEYASLRVDQMTGDTRALAKIGNLREKMATIADGDSTTLFRQAEDNIRTITSRLRETAR